MPRKKKQNQSEELEYQKITERHEELMKFVQSVMSRGMNDETYTYSDAAKELVKYPVACCMLCLMFRESGEFDGISSLLTALVREEVLQNAPPVPLVSEQRRLH